MPIIDESSGTTRFKITYHGPGLGGKTTNIQHVFRCLPTPVTTKLISLATDTDRPLFFDFAPPGQPHRVGRAVRLHLYTVPGPVFYDVSRLHALKGVDGVIFVADSQQTRMDANVESLKNLESHFATLGIDATTFPLVIQYNKRDLPTILPVETMQPILNPDRRPSFEAVAYKGVNVLATLHSAWTLLMERHGLDPTGADEMLEWTPRPWETRPGRPPAGAKKKSWLDELLGR